MDIIFKQTFTFHKSKHFWYIFNLSRNIPCRFITYEIITFVKT